jgi:hypothetical protein
VGNTITGLRSASPFLHPFFYSTLSLSLSLPFFWQVRSQGRPTADSSSQLTNFERKPLLFRTTDRTANVPPSDS